MAIEFFLEECKDSTNAKVFGLCDAPAPAQSPAYISPNGNHKAQWLAQVINKEQKMVDFYAIDHCVSIPKTGTPKKEESRCDGLLVTENYYKFIELKDCKLRNKDWRVKGKAQLATTIGVFKNNYSSIPIKNISAQLCNKKHLVTPIYQDSQDEFLAKTGIVLTIKQQIVL